MKYDLVIIGGGAAGMMTAISTFRCHPDWKILLLEKNSTLGRKILITGNGRCNLTNVNLNTTYFNNPEFVSPVLKQFSYKEIDNFFDDLGLLVYEEKKGNTGKIFPVSDAASSVVNLLGDAVEKSKVEVKTEVICENVVNTSDGFLIKIKNNKNDILADKVVLTTGGKTYPALGADGNGFDLAKKLGHKIITPVPSGVPLEGKNKLTQELQGLKIPVEISVLKNNKKVTGDLMFAKYGLSGTAVLSLSRDLSIFLNRENQKEVTVLLNFMPGYDFDLAVDFWSKRKQNNLERDIVVDWCGVFPPKFSNVFLKMVGVAGKYSEINKSTIEKLVSLLINYEYKITATRGWNEAEFTAGGIDCEEIDPITLESKKIAGLYFAGEVIDVDGDIGGYNLSWAWASGFVVGQSV